MLSYKAADTEPPADWEADLPLPGAVDLPGGGVVSATLCAPPQRPGGPERRVAFVDAAKVGEKLTVRWWRDGDRVAPVGMTGSRKLQDVFCDQKVPRRERRRVPIVTGEDRCVVWVAGLCVDRSVCVCPSTRRCIRLCWDRADGE